MNLRALVPVPGAAFVCRLCGHIEPAPPVRCPACHRHGTYGSVEDEDDQDAEPADLVAFDEVKQKRRARLFSVSKTFDRLLGGGLKKGGTYLIAGQWGAGKSTLALQLIEGAPGGVVYVSAEEDALDVKERAERLGLRRTGHLYFVETTCVESAFDADLPDDHLVTVYDSLHALTSRERDGAAGDPHQVDAVMRGIVEFARETKTAAVILAHHSKDGTVKGTTEGPHAVTMVSELVGDENTGVRTWRIKKNRHGETHIRTAGGLVPAQIRFEMTARGLVALKEEDS